MTSHTFRITGIAQPVTVHGELPEAAQAALQDGWLSVLDLWNLDRACSAAGHEHAAQALFRCLYGKFSHARSTRDFANAELEALPGKLSIRTLNCTYDQIRDRIRRLVTVDHADTVLWIAENWTGEIDAAADIAEDDKRFLRAFLHGRLLRMNKALVGGATRFFTEVEAQRFDQFVKRENYPGLWQFLRERV
jgi:hypothetical protein